MPPETDHTSQSYSGRLPLPGEIDETTRVPLKAVIGIVGMVVTVLVIWFGMEARVAAVNSRIDGLEGRIAHLERASCSMEQKMNIVDPDCSMIAGRTP